jgi:hypothetical protein
MKRGFFVLAFLLVVSSTSGQQSVDSSRSFYIQSFPKHFLVYPVLKYRSLSFEVRNPKRMSQAVAFRPNNTSSFGVGFYIFDINLELTFAIPLGERKQRIFGETNAQDLQINILTKRWGLDVYHQKYSGFYKDDERMHIVNGEAYPQRPDIRSLNFGLSGSYAFRKNFSLRAPYNFIDRQLKSRGSFIVYGTLNSFKVEADSALLSPVSRIGISADADFKNLKYASLSIAPGYSYTFVYKRLFVNGTLTVGPAHHWVYYKKSDNTNKYDISLNTTSSLRFGIGYNSSRFFGGIGVNLQSRVVKFDGVRFENASTTVKVLIGYRFKKKGILEKHLWELLPPLLK